MPRTNFKNQITIKQIDLEVGIKNKGDNEDI